MAVFINGQQKRVRRPPTIQGLPVDEFVRRNADPIWLMQHGYYELLEPPPAADCESPPAPNAERIEDEPPF